MAYSDTEYFTVETAAQDVVAVDMTIRSLDGVTPHSSAEHMAVVEDDVAYVVYSLVGPPTSEATMKKVRRLSRGKAKFKFEFGISFAGLPAIDPGLTPQLRLQRLVMK